MEITTETNETFKRQIILFSIQLDLKKKKNIERLPTTIISRPNSFWVFFHSTYRMNPHLN